MTPTRRRREEVASQTKPRRAALEDSSTLERAIEAIVDRRVHAILGALDDARYRTPDRLPPGVSARTMREACRSGRVRGAVREGRQWSCPRDAWHSARARRPAPRLELVPDARSDEELAALAIRGCR
jgi:hypothetical protein